MGTSAVTSVWTTDVASIAARGTAEKDADLRGGKTDVAAAATDGVAGSDAGERSRAATAGIGLATTACGCGAWGPVAGMRSSGKMNFGSILMVRGIVISRMGADGSCVTTEPSPLVTCPRVAAAGGVAEASEELESSAPT